MNNQVIVSINGVEYAVKKMPLGKFAEVLQALEELPKQLENVDSLSTDDVVAQLPQMVATALPELTKILSIASNVPATKIEEAGLDELTELVIAILDVNNIEKIVENIKKITARKAFQGVNMRNPSQAKSA